MRVIAGEFRSRRLQTLSGLATRPTPDRLRESLFSILASRLAGAVFVDAYAGSGAVGIEALSRGASKAIFLESSRAAVAVIRANLEGLGTGDRALVRMGQAAKLLRGLKADVVFLDPPYAQTAEYAAVFAAAAEAAPGLLIAQHAAKEELEDAYGGFARRRKVRQGDNVLSFYEPA